MKKECLVSFYEDFLSENDSLPGLWQVEQNSDLPQVPAFRYGENCIEFLSEGNKYLPVIPSISDFTLESSFSIKYNSAGAFGLIFCFHYDSVTARGQYLGIYNYKHKPDEITVVYGSTKANEYFPQETKTAVISTGKYLSPFSIKINVKNNKLQLLFMEKKFDFSIIKGTGKIAFARSHFFGILRMTRFIISGIAADSRKKILQKTIPLPAYQTHYPIFCDVTVYEQGDCMESDLIFHGGIPDYPTGEGNYHSIRANILEYPYFKIITKEQITTEILHKEPIVLVPPNLVPPFFFEELHKQPQWPFTAKVRFTKPVTGYDFAVGFGSYFENENQNQALTPAETVFDKNGKVIYAGVGITDGKTIKTEFISQEKKEILARIPKSDPRYKQAIQFAKKNHYFFEGEKPNFTIRLSAENAIPLSFEVTLEDAFFNVIRPLKFKKNEKIRHYGVWNYNCTELTVEKLNDLPVGVYHIRIKSTDASTNPLEQHCAFEIMGKNKNSPSPQEASGLPFLYNARTEVRGLMNDSFDPYIGESVNEGHYVSSCVFLPEALRKFKIAPTLKAYGRKNFAWISTRTLDDVSMEANTDIIRDSDYINYCLDCSDDIHGYATAIGTYRHKRFQDFINFLESLHDPSFDIPALKKMCRDGNYPDAETYIKMAEKYWEDWLDAYSQNVTEDLKKLLKKIRKINPDAQLCMYGPFAIYASAYKGPDAVRLLGHGTITPDIIGFWQYEDYPVSCGYPIERGAFTHTGTLMALKNSRIYPEIYSVNKLKRGCPDGAVFYAHPPFGNLSDAEDPEGRVFIRRVLNYVYGSAHISNHNYTYWEKCGFQTCNFPEKWFTELMKIWGFIRKNPPAAPLRSIAYVAPGDSKRKNHAPFIYDQGGRLIVRKTSLEDVPFLFEEAAFAGVCNGFQLFEEDILSLTKDQLVTLVLPPLKGMKKQILEKIRRLHSEGVNLVTFEDAASLEDLFGIKDSGKKQTISLVTATGEYCTGMTEFCDDPRCTGRYKNVDAEILLNAEIPVLTRKKNGNACAVFFNVPPHFVKENRLRARGSHGKMNISPLIHKISGKVMRSLAPSAVQISEGRLLACHTKNNDILLIVGNPYQEKELISEITLHAVDDFAGCFADTPECNREIVLIRTGKNSRTYRVWIPASEFMIMRFSQIPIQK